jgi:REP element-mobilizing transposase RayT
MDSCGLGNKRPLPFPAKRKRQLLFQHIKTYALQKEIYVDCIGGFDDHVHCLFELHAEVSLAKTMQLLKGESSHWANQQGLFLPKLDWANEYFACSVSESVVEKVRAYIQNQEEHHKRITFAEEYELFLEKYGLRKDKQRHP